MRTSHEAVLIQNKQEVIRCGVQEPAQLQRLLELFFGYEREEIADFRKAVKQFKSDLPEVLKALREMIGAAERDNDSFGKAAILFLKHAQETINPSVTTADVREMLIQHILTEEIFSQVFDDSNFHRQNNVAKKLYALENTFFTGKVKHDTLAGLRPYYAAIKSAAALVTSHHEKQNFLKTIYENFYKVYDKKKADRLGVIYTPNEIVRFMIESADWLCQKHFGKALIDKNVEILDPAAGTGTFITELIEHFRGQRQKLRHKYLEELHANEVAILPYYVANLNIEATYTAINGFEEYPNLCFVDTLDNTAALKAQKGQHVGDLFGAVSKENVARIKRQNAKKISVIIGNPPYNAWQENFNLQNPNRPYRLVDDHIRATYVREGTAQNQSGVYDMYTRFYRWASDRLADDGIVAFISNRSYIDSRIMDGFRRVVGCEFSEIHVVDLGADIRANPKLSGTKHNVFGIQTGVAIGFFVKHKSCSKPARIFYSRRPEFETAAEKLVFISETALQSMDFDEITPDKKCNWIGVEQNDFDELIPMFDPLTARKRSAQARTLFGRFSMGIQPKCDNWIYDKDGSNLRRKMEFFTRAFNDAVTKNNFPNDGLKWHRELVKLAKKQEKSNIRLGFDPKRIICSLYRPYFQEYFYNDRFIISMNFLQQDIFAGQNGSIVVSGIGANQPFSCLATTILPSHDLLQKAQSAPRYFYKSGRIDNVNDWAFEQFRARYEQDTKPKRAVTKDAIFHYVYGVLHDPIYREKYALNLKRQFPRIPFYANFWRWAGWGEKLMALHVSYEIIEPWPLECTDTPEEKSPSSLLKNLEI